MGRIVRIQKTLLADAIHMDTPEDERTIREWFAEHFEALGESAAEAFASAVAIDLSDLTQNDFWVARDFGTKILYFIPGDSFESNFQVISSQTIPADDDPSPFKF